MEGLSSVVDGLVRECNVDVDFLIANVEARVAFSFAFLENKYFCFLRIYF